MTAQYYLYATPSTDVLIDLEQNQSYPDESYWFTIQTGNYCYIVNKYIPYYYISIDSTSGAVNSNQYETSDYAKWNFEYVGAAVPVHRQTQTNTCGKKTGDGSMS